MTAKRKKTHLTTHKRYRRNGYKKPRNDFQPKCDWDTTVLLDINNNQTEAMSDEEHEQTEMGNVKDENILENTENDKENPPIASCQDLFGTVIEKLKANGMDYFLQQLFLLIANNNFPFQSICFVLFVEFVQWLSLKNTTGMRYSPDSKEFWWTGQMLFGGKFIRFMQGFKHKDSIIYGTSSKGYFDPLETKINFAVPSDSILSEYCPLNGLDNLKSEIGPGIIQPILNLYAKNGKDTSHILTFDGKKIIPNTADINLLGCEDTETKKMQTLIKEDQECIHNMTNLIQKLQSEGSFAVIEDFTENDKLYLADYFKRLLQQIGLRIQKVRDGKRKKQYALSKLEEKASSNSALPRDQYLMNHLKTFIHQCSITLTDAMTNINNICDIIATLIGGKSCFVKEENVILEQQSNYAELLSTDDVRKEMNIEESEAIPGRFVKQRSDDWFEVRKKMKVTGSTTHRAIGLATLKEQKIHFDEVFSSLETEKSNLQQEAMKYGSENEINGIATLVGKILPVMYPNLVFCEEGIYAVKDENGEPFMAVSPDGSLRRIDKETEDYGSLAEVSIEIKCPFSFKSQGLPAFSTVPHRYLCQCFLEQHVLETKDHLMICWTPESTSVFIVPYNHDIVNAIVTEVKDTYYTNVPRRPTRLSEKAKKISNQLVDEVSKCTFVGEFPSAIAVRDTSNFHRVPGIAHQFGMDDTSSERDKINVDTVCKVLLKSQSHLIDLMKLYKKPASEAIVFSLADTDRSWKKEVGHGMPIGYLFKGYSLGSNCMRNVNSCRRKRV